MAPLKIIVFFGSVREGRMGIRLANYLTETLKSMDEFEVELFDPEVLNFPLLRRAFHHYPSPSDAPELLQECNKKIVAADGYVLVSAEYNHSIPPALSNMLDHFPIESYTCKPCALVTYSMGSYGGVRAGVQLRSLVGELGMVTPQFIFSVGKIQDMISPEGKPLDDRVKSGAAQMAEQLVWYASALKAKRESGGNPKEVSGDIKVADPTP